MVPPALHPWLLAGALGTCSFVLGAQAPAPAVETRCGLGGIVPGSPWPGSQNPEAYVAGSPKLCKAPSGAFALQYKVNTAGYEQFVLVQDKKVLAVAREYEGSQEAKVLEALKARYGEPANPGIEIGKMGMVMGKVQTRTIWLDPTCGTRIEFVKPDSGMFKGSFAKSTRIAVIVTTADKKAPGDSPNPLD